MTSMRIDGDKSVKVWARRLKAFAEAMAADGVLMDVDYIYLDGEEEWEKVVVHEQ